MDRVVLRRARLVLQDSRLNAKRARSETDENREPGMEKGMVNEDEANAKRIKTAAQKALSISARAQVPSFATSFPLKYW